MRRACFWFLTLPALGAPVAAQEVEVSASSVAFDFSDASQTGLESYVQRATSLDLSVPILSWLSAGGTMSHASASMGSVLDPETGFSGLTDAELFTSARRGPLRLRASYLLDSGVAPASAQSMAVAGLAAYEFLPLPVRSWGGGGGHSLDVGVELGSREASLEFLVGTRSYGTLTHSDAQAFDYALGAEKHLSLRGALRPTALTRVEGGLRFASVNPDDAVAHDPSGSTEHSSVFEPGSRFGAHLLAEFPLWRTSVRVSSDLSARGSGSTRQPPFADATGRTVHDSAARFLVSGAIETRTSFRHLPLKTSVRAHSLTHEDDPERGWLGSAGIGTDVQPPGPWPGNLLLSATATVHRGWVRVAGGSGSSVSGWGVSASVLWQPGR